MSQEFATKMRKAGLSTFAIEVFENQFQRMLNNEKTTLAETDIRPVMELPNLSTLSDKFYDIGISLMSQTVMIKLNGGLGTSMGLAGAKSTLRVKNDETFLDITAKQTIAANAHLILMNSFSTLKDSEKVMTPYKMSHPKMFSDFVQNQVPKINIRDHLPASYAQQPELEWCPPGHGDLYSALIDQKLLHRLREQGIKWAFISNVDNLGATISPKILGYLYENNIPFLMEVAIRTDADKKGGHLAISSADGRLLLRELAQCPESDKASFQDVGRYQYFNTNNIWINLDALWHETKEGTLPLALPLILNRKTVNPRDPSSEPVYQIETAVGAAIAVIKNSRAITVSRSRFAPVKTTSDLLLVQSDLFELSSTYEFQLKSNVSQDRPLVELDQKYFGLIDQFESRFARGIPSLKKCLSLKVTGDVYFGSHVQIVGHVKINNPNSAPMFIPDNAVIDSNITQV